MLEYATHGLVDHVEHGFPTLFQRGLLSTYTNMNFSFVA